MDAEPQWVPLGEEELELLSETLKRVFRRVALTLFLAIAVTASFFRDGVDLGAATYDPAGAVHRTYPGAGATDVTCSNAAGGWTCSYRVDGYECWAPVFHGQRVVGEASCARR